MNIEKTTNLTAGQKEAIYMLWNSEYPAQLQYTRMAELDNYLNNLQDPSHYFATDDEYKVAGWAFVFKREGEMWFAIIVASTWQGKGVGTRLLNELKQDNPVLNGWVTDHERYTKYNGTPYPSPLPFYLKNDFTICSDIRLEVEKLSAVKIYWAKPNN